MKEDDIERLKMSRIDTFIGTAVILFHNINSQQKLSQFFFQV